MKFRPIQDALSGEHLLAVSPAIRPFVADHPKKRLNLYPGRQLTATALTAEQDGRGTRLALYGRLAGSGVVDGFSAALDPVTGDVVISAGVAIASSGEEVVLDGSLRIQPRALPVFTPAVSQLPPGAPPNPVLDDFIETPAELPPAGILVVRPVTAELLLDDPRDPCEEAPEDAAFEDQRLINGARLMFYPWIESWAPLPARSPAWRNRLAYAVFSREQQLVAGELRPWDEAGVAVGLIAFDENWSPLFVDRFSVVRAASSRGSRTVVPGAGGKELWQARINQFAEHLGSLGNPVDSFAAEFEQMPPAGLLTRDFLFLDPPTEVVFAARLTEQGRDSTGEVLLAVRPRRDASGVLIDAALSFDMNWSFDIPGPVADVEAQFVERATPRTILELAAFMGGSSRPIQGSLHLEVTAPRPGLAIADVDALLSAPRDTGFVVHFEVVTGVNVRGRLRGTLQLRDRLSSPISAAFPDWITDAAPVPIEQLDAVFAESGSQAPISAVDRLRFLVPVPQAVYDPRLLAVEDTDPQFAEFLAGAATRREDARARRAEIQARFSALVRAATGEDAEFPEGDPGANPGEPPLPSTLPPHEDEDPFGTVLAGGQFQAIRLNEFFEASVRNAPLLPQERALVDPNDAAFAGLLRFIDTIENRIQRADDTVNIGFTRLKSDVYRVLQYVVGDAEATRLATSPALAAIAKTTSATATGEQLRDFYQASRQVRVAPRQPSGAAPTTPTGGTVLINTGTVATRPPAGTVGPRGTLTGVLGTLSAGRITDFALTERAPGIPDILGEAPIPGKSEIRTTSIASRLEAPRSPESRDYAVATKFQVYTSLRALEINVADVQVPGVSTQQAQQPGQPPVFRANPVALGTLAINTVLNEPQAHLLDEAAFFANSAEVTEHTVAALRAIEGRVAQYRAVLEAAKDALEDIRVFERKASNRLGEIEDTLAEARHDVTVATSLLREEQARVDAINSRRRQIIAEHVRFLAYHRPSNVERPSTAPLHSLQPGVTDFSEPRCLQIDSNLPDGLRAFVDLFRDSPVNWFPSVQALLNKVDRLDVFSSWLQAARLRAAQAPPREFVLTAPPPGRRSFASAISTTFLARQSVLQTFRANRAGLDLSSSTVQSWQGASRVASEALSLGDVIDGGHGRQQAAQQAARELERIERAAACLYSGSGRLPPVIRLLWAEQLSQFDDPVNLRNLQVLPRWTSVDTLQRRELQAVVDFLFQRIDPAKSEAADLVNDLIRSAILVASHAPITQIIEGLVAEATDVRPNGSVTLTVDTSRVRVGMNVVLFAGQATVARGVVEDLRNGFAVTRIVQASPGTRLAARARAQFVESRALQLLR